MNASVSLPPFALPTGRPGGINPAIEPLPQIIAGVRPGNRDQHRRGEPVIRPAAGFVPISGINLAATTHDSAVA